jgi:alcohol dehydrogenase class IV
MERSALLAHGMAANVAAMRARAPHHPALERYSAIASLLTGRSEVSVEDGIDWVRALSAELNIPTLRTWGVTEADLRALLRKSRKPAVCKPIHCRLRRRS